ncbi:MAG: SBBP repeat-containing protein [Proteobacteria bacterium]|nr:SBBP repeat-containing protein [Pseudomonadota bacterium]
MVKKSLARVRLAATAGLMVCLLNACATTPDKLMFSMPANNLQPGQLQVWPRPPQTPRYIYIGDIRGESSRAKSDKKKGSALSRFFSALVGLESESIPLINLLRPQHGAVDDKGRIYVADPGRQAVFVFDEKSGEFFIWNEAELNIPFKSPVGIAIAENTILVTDSEQGLVYVFTEEGQLINTLGAEILQRPTGIAYDPLRKRVFVSDTKADNIKIFNLQGALLDVMGARGSNPGEFNHPTFLNYHDDKLYVADSLNARIQIFNDADESIKIIGQRGLYIGNFTRPKGIAVDSDGNIYVTESYYDHLLIFNPMGELLMSIGGSGALAGQFSQPTGVWIDSNDRLFVSDMLNSRISIFQYLGEN